MYSSRYRPGMIRIAQDLNKQVQCACGNLGSVLSLSEYLGILGYSEKGGGGGVNCISDHHGTFLGWSKYLSIL